MTGLRRTCIVLGLGAALFAAAGCDVILQGLIDSAFDNDTEYCDYRSYDRHDHHRSHSSPAPQAAPRAPSPPPVYKPVNREEDFYRRHGGR